MSESKIEDPNLVRRRDALQIGELDRHLAARVKTGELRRLYRGFYTFTADLDQLDRHVRDTEIYRRTVLAAADNGEPNKAISHWSAAVLHRLPVLGGDSSRVHFTANRIGGGRRRGRACVVHGSTWETDEVAMIGEFLVTSRARTAVDVARSGSFFQAVCVFDGALHAGVPRGELESVLRRSVGRTGISVARAALAVADGKSESIGESLSRALILSFGDIPLPRLQHRFLAGDGTFVARTDFDWGGLVAGEFDGYAKYIRYLRPGETTEQAYEREKWREQRLRRIGVVVVRWNWSDLQNPERLRRILVDALTAHGLMASA
ncbi:hypothetical protein [Williamsia muralis]|uniref:hypothetical protein n=1 Tax=Williamsia marianensis TaxID=85044 RepID=UPI003813F5A9